MMRRRYPSLTNGYDKMDQELQTTVYPRTQPPLYAGTSYLQQYRGTLSSVMYYEYLRHEQEENRIPPSGTQYGYMNCRVTSTVLKIFLLCWKRISVISTHHQFVRLKPGCHKLSGGRNKNGWRPRCKIMKPKKRPFSIQIPRLWYAVTQMCDFFCTQNPVPLHCQ